MNLNEVNGTIRAPSRSSIRTLVGLACVLAVATFWIPMFGDQFDGRHLVGFLLGLVATVTVIGQAAHRSADRRIAERQETAGLHRRVTQTGTWFREGDGAEVYVAAVLDESRRRVYFLGGQLPPGVVQDGPYSRAQARNVLLSMESGQWSPVDDLGTRRIRNLLALSGWREDREIIAETMVQRGYRS